MNLIHSGNARSVRFRKTLLLETIKICRTRNRMMFLVIPTANQQPFSGLQGENKVDHSEVMFLRDK